MNKFSLATAGIIVAALVTSVSVNAATDSTKTNVTPKGMSCQEFVDLNPQTMAPVAFWVLNEDEDLFLCIPVIRVAMRRCSPPNGMTIFIMPSTFLRPERPMPTTTILLMPRKNISQERWLKDLLIRERFHHKPANLAAQKVPDNPRSPL